MIVGNVPLSVVDNLINIMHETKCLKTDQSDIDLMGHTGMSHVDPELSKKAMRYFDDIMTPLVGYEPHSHGRYGCYRNPIPMHNDGINYLGSQHDGWDKARPANTTVFIPLRVVAKDGISEGKTSTIFFEQLDPWVENAGKVPASNEESFYMYQGHFGWDDSYDYSDLVNFTHEPFDPEIHQKYLTQHPIEKLYGFSFHEENPWEIGQVYFFESSRLHCSKHFTECSQKDCFLIKCNTDLFPHLE